MTGFAELMPTAREAVDIASELIRTRWPGRVTSKGDRDMATEVDYEIEQRLRTLLRQRTPHIGFIGEEEGAFTGDGDLTWVLDPVDGTANFLHGIPLCGVSLGLLCQDRPVLGVVDLPLLAMRYSAVEGGGAVGPRGTLHHSAISRLSEAIVAVGDYAVGPDAAERNAQRLAITARLAATAQRVRMHGSVVVDLVWLAEGRVDAVIVLSNKPWDMTAGVIIAREAGAVVLDQNGARHSASSAATIATSPELAPQIIPVLREAVT